MKTKLALFVCLLFCSSTYVFSQNVAINISGALANASAMLDVSSVSSGLLVPRMSTIQRNAIAAPASSLLVFDNTLNAFYYYDGVAAIWRPLLANNTGWTTLGNAGTVNGTNFLGTTDNVSLDIRTNNTIRATFMNTGELRMIGAGNVTNPSYAWTGDPNTGIYNVAADVLGITTGGVERFRLGTTEAVVNEMANNYDFRVEGIGNANVFIVDASVNMVGFSGVPTAPYELGVPVHNMYYPFEIGNDGNLGQQITIGYYRGADPTLNPEQNGGWGYVGYNAAGAGNDQYWWRGYSGGWINVSQRDLKKNIQPISEDVSLESYVVNSIRNMKPSLYNYKNELDNMEPGLENHYRPAFRIGLIADESPDYILDESYSGVDIYGLATMSLVGIQHNMKEIEKLKADVKVQDFGSQSLSGTELWVPFVEDFNGTIPVVTLSSNSPSVILSIVEKTDKGFKVVASKNENNLTFDWIAIAKVKSTQNSEKQTNVFIPANIKDKLEVPIEIKTRVLDFYKNFKSTVDRQ